MSKASLKLGKGIDWEKLNKVVTSAEGQSKLQALRRAYDDVSGIIQEKFTNARSLVFFFFLFFWKISWFLFVSE